MASGEPQREAPTAAHERCRDVQVAAAQRLLARRDLDALDDVAAEAPAVTEPVAESATVASLSRQGAQYSSAICEAASTIDADRARRTGRSRRRPPAARTADRRRSSSRARTATPAGTRRSVSERKVMRGCARRGVEAQKRVQGVALLVGAVGALAARGAAEDEGGVESKVTSLTPAAKNALRWTVARALVSPTVRPASRSDAAPPERGDRPIGRSHAYTHLGSAPRKGDPGPRQPRFSLPWKAFSADGGRAQPPTGGSE